MNGMEKFLSAAKFRTAEDKRIDKLEEALRSILGGTPMDAVGNRNDNGLIDMSQRRLPTLDDIGRWRNLAKDALKKPY